MRGPGPRRPTARVLAVALVLCAAAATGGPVAGAPRAQLTISPERIPVTSFYHGSTLTADVVVPSGSEIALKLEGGRSRVTFNRKGRVFLLWMNVGDVTIDNAPHAYILYTSTELSELASGETLQRWGLGLDAVAPQIETRGEGIDRETMLLEFFNYKEKSGLYRRSYGSLRPDLRDDGHDQYSVSIPLPSTIPVGRYLVGLYVFRDGRIVQRASEAVTIEKTGFPLFVSRLAREHEAEYGLLAIVVAVMAGFFIGLVFSRVGRRRPR